MDFINEHVRDLARKHTQSIDDIVLSLLKPWQRTLISRPWISKPWAKPLRLLIKRSAGITIEYHNQALQTPGLGIFQLVHAAQ